ncbi:MAG TPA: TatD family hydrolase, partial [Ignavibacteriaceae bacterium]
YQVIEKAKLNKVDCIIVPSTDVASAKQTLKLADKYDFIYAAVGVHPHDSKDWDASLLNEIEELSGHPKVVAIGEIGLDYYYDFSPRDKQIEAFRAQIELAIKRKLPVIVHNREADKDMMEIISSYCGNNLRAQFHCFNSSLDDALEYIKMNHIISFTGNITFKKADELRKVVSGISLDNLLLETDSPFMTPEPHRGERNEPANVKQVAEKIAEIYNVKTEDVARVTSFNAFRFFGLGNKNKISYTYQIGKNLYVNITNRCNADCFFCNRKGDATLHGYNLKMTKDEEPPAEVYIQEIGDPAKYGEIVFCGYGEPTIRWDVVKKVAKYVKENGGRTRLNTNGHGSFINKRDISPEFIGVIDVVSISINTVDPRQYAKIMKLDTRFFNEMVTFAKSVKQYVEKLVMTVVSIDEIEIEKAREVVQTKFGAEFRVRPYF